MLSYDECLVRRAASSAQTPAWTAAAGEL